jgi:hypothetical protein
VWVPLFTVRNNIVKYVMNFKAYNRLLTEGINILYRSVDILDKLFSDRLSNIRMDLVDKPIGCDLQ